MLTTSVSWFSTSQREVTDEFECVRDTRLRVQITNELVNISRVAREISPGKHDRSLGNAASEMQRLVQQKTRSSLPSTGKLASSAQQDKTTVQIRIIILRQLLFALLVCPLND